MATKALMTAEQFARMETADTEKFELVEGDLVPLPGATYRHNKIRDRIGHRLSNYLDINPIGDSVGETDCQLSADTVRCPDVSVFLKRTHEIDLDKTPVPFAPDIAIEVLSPSESAINVRRKVLDYLGAGSQEVWLLDHANGEVLIHSAAGIRVLKTTDILESPALPGFSATVAELLMCR
jgi:Uma2 family endonuclease